MKSLYDLFLVLKDTSEFSKARVPFLFAGYHAKLNKFPVFNFNDELKDLCVSAVSANTTKATLYALNVWRYWCMTKGLKDYMDITKVTTFEHI